MYQPRGIKGQIVWKLGKLAAVMGAMCLVASFASLVLIGGPSGAVAAAATPSPAASAGCHPLSNEGTCYEPGEFCRNTDHGVSGVAGDGKAITCEDNDGWRWEPQTSSATPTGVATTGSTPTQVTTPATPSASSTPSAPIFPGATTGAPAGAPATGGGTGPGVSGALAAAGCALMVAGGGLVLLSRRRTRRLPM